MQEVILAHVQSKLLRWWHFWSLLIVALVFLQTILGRFEGEPRPAWIWVLLTLLPGTLLLYLGIYLQMNPTKVITLAAFRAVYWLTFTYLLLALGTILAEPFAMQYNDYTLSEYLQLSYTWLMPINVLLIAAYGIMFFRKSVLFPAKAIRNERYNAPAKLELSKELKIKCRKYIANNQLLEVFDTLANHYENQLPDEILALQRRYNEIEEEKNIDTIEPAAAQRELNRIAIALLKLL